MKKVLILSTSYGHGHMSTAEAIREGILLVNTKKVEVDIVDFTDIISELLNKATKRMYNDAAKYVPYLYKLFFELTDTEMASRAINELNYIFSRDKILNFFRDKSPDLIVCNSPHWQYIASLARQEEFKNTPMVSVVTDIVTIHSSWIIGDPDYFLVANKETEKSLHAMGISSKNIKVLGYPVKSAFYDRGHRQPIRDQLGIANNQKIILFLASGLKSSFVQDTLNKINQLAIDSKIVTITGKDDKLFKRLKSRQHSNTMLINWTSSLADFVKASDIVITKAGGSSIMECIVARKPVVVSKIIPGQEKGNADYISDNRLGIVALEPSLIANAIVEILTYHKTYSTNLDKYANTGSLKDISKFLLSLI